MVNFYVENQGFIFGVLAIVAILFSALKLIPLLQSKNILTDKNIETALQLTVLAKILLTNVNLKDDIKKQSQFVIDICSQLLTFTQSVHNVKSDDELTVTLKNAIHSAFVQLGVQVNKDVQDVIDLGIAYAIHKSKAQ